MSDNIDPMNMGKTFVLRNEKRINLITSYFLNTQTTVNSRDVARLERKQAMPGSKSVCLLQVLLTAHFVIFHVNINFYQKPINRLLVLTGGKVSNSKQVTSKRQTCY